MGKIVILDENTSNQIAAGEVVERPVSVVKELVENSIDANATNISIEIKNGGISFVKITDNGTGLDEDDVEIAFERHSTSKIRSSKDLESIRTLGFRGEALASIASISSVELTSKTNNSVAGRYIRVQGGVVKEAKQVGCPVGTTIIVRELFYNTPARFKFLKKDTTEAQYISETVNRIAIGTPAVSFKLTNKGSVITHTPGNNDLQSTIFSIYGKEIAKELIEVDYKDDNLIITGFVGKPQIARSNRNQQLIYLNGRYIKDKIITSAIDEAYKTYILKNKFAFVVLKIELNPLNVDVNVHPTKMEVRFSNEQDIFKGVYHAIQNALESKPHVKEVYFTQENEKQTLFRIKEDTPRINYVQQNIVNQANQRDGSLNQGDGSLDSLENIPVNNILNHSYSPDNQNQQKQWDTWDTGTGTLSHCMSREDQVGLPNQENRPINSIKCDKQEPSLMSQKWDKEPVPRDHFFVDAKIIGQAFMTYIIMQHKNELYLIDQHAAHERVIYEKIRDKYKRKENISQLLVTPEVIELTNKEMMFIEKERQLFADIGFEIENFGSNSILLRSVPYIVEEQNSLKNVFVELLDNVIESTSNNLNLVDDEAIYSIACKMAVKANKNLGDIEIKNLLYELSLLNQPFTCPHGRPTIIKITKYDIEKMFKRIL